MSTSLTNTEILVGLGDKIVTTDEYSKDIKNDMTRISIEKIKAIGD